MLNQAKARKRPLRTALRQSLAKQQAEEQQRKISTNFHYSAASSSDHLLIPVPALQINAEDEEDSTSQYSLNDVQLYAIPIDNSHEDHVWRHSAPSSLVPFEVDEQLDDIVSSIENDLVTSQSSSSASRLSSSEYFYRGGLKKEPRPSEMTDEMRVLYEQERRRKDAHNDIEKRRREKIKDHIEELRTIVPGSFDFVDQPNSTSEILEATLNYVQKLQNNQKQLSELKDRVDHKQRLQRRLLIQQQILVNLLNAPPTAVDPPAVAVAKVPAAGAPRVVTMTTVPAAPVDSMIYDDSMEYSANSVFNDVLLDHCDNTVEDMSDLFI